MFLEESFIVSAKKICEDVNDPVPNTCAANAFPGAHERPQRAICRARARRRATPGGGG